LTPERLGFVGLGAMGRGMALALCAAGHEVVVHNRTRAKERELVAAGAEAAPSPQAVAARCDVVFSCLGGTEAVTDVYLAPGGLAGSARAGQVLVEHGTFSPRLARSVAAAAAACGAAFVDAPVTGGPAGARARTLTVMAGGDAGAVDRVGPMLAAYAERVVHVGASGRGAELKVVNQLLVICHVAACAEALALIRALGLPLDACSDVLGSGWAASAMLLRGLERARRGTFAGDGATLAGLAAVRPLVAGCAGEEGVPAVVLPAAAALLERALAAGLGDCDVAGLVEVFEQRGGGNLG
jgi:3-hydroxyisobutyrate dehydrogenase-like beta-hydroxyacid dehydrogenase